MKNSPTRHADFDSVSSPKSVTSPDPSRRHAIPCGSPSNSSEISHSKAGPSNSIGATVEDGEINDRKCPVNPTIKSKKVENIHRGGASPESTVDSESEDRKGRNSRGHPSSHHKNELADKSYNSLMRYFFKDAVYFQMKSINHENVALSKLHGVWSTPVRNELRLHTAFRQHRNVILIFSVQQSGGFQGFARMVSEAGPSSRPIPWVLPARLGQRSLGGVLKVEWLCTKELPFHETQDLYNSFNDNKPVKVARDGQQIESDVGKKLCKLFPQDSRRRLLDSVSTLKMQISHRKKQPIEIPDSEIHYPRGHQHMMPEPPMMNYTPMPPYHMPIDNPREPYYYDNHPHYQPNMEGNYYRPVPPRASPYYRYRPYHRSVPNHHDNHRMAR